jgi:hypothetical protein
VKGKIVLLIFALPFFLVGVWMFFSISTHVMDAWQMRNWVPVQATLSNAGYETVPGDDSTSYEAFAQYSYRFGGREYTNNRVAIAGGADNIGDYQVDLGRRLGGAWSRGESIAIYVNPDAPHESIVDRELRWGLIGFKSIFAIAFGGVGLGLIIFTLRARKPKDSSDPVFRDKPWLVNDQWQSPMVKSGSKAAMYFMLGFAALWNLISAPLPFVVYTEITEKQNYAALLGLLFPVIGIALLVWAAQKVREWKRFGPAPVKLDPFPGAIGGHVGGTIDIRLPFDPNARHEFSLTNIYSYMSGSGKNRSRSESAKWQDSQVVRGETGSKGTRLAFRFDVPAGLTESDAARNDDSYYLWRLNLSTELEGADIDRDYEIPVYATGERSRFLSSHQLQLAHDENEKFADIAVAALIQKQSGIAGAELFYPAGRKIASPMAGIVIGGIFAAIGWFLMFSEGHLVFGGIFAAIGSLAVFGSLYSMLNSLQVVSGPEYLKTVRRILGIPVRRRQIQRSEFVRFSKGSGSRTQTGNKHVMHYSIFAEDRHGQKIVVGDGFKGERQASAAIRFIGRETGLKSKDDQIQGPIANDVNLLAGDP